MKAYGAGRKMNFFCGAGHAGRFHDGEKKLELVNIHEKILLREGGARASGIIYQIRKRLNRMAFYTGDARWLQAEEARRR